MVVQNIVKQQICNLESKLATTPKRYSAQYLAASLGNLKTKKLRLVTIPHRKKCIFLR